MTSLAWAVWRPYATHSGRASHHVAVASTNDLSGRSWASTRCSACVQHVQHRVLLNFTRAESSHADARDAPLFGQSGLLNTSLSGAISPDSRHARAFGLKRSRSWPPMELGIEQVLSEPW